MKQDFDLAVSQVGEPVDLRNKLVYGRHAPEDEAGSGEDEASGDEDDDEIM